MVDRSPKKADFLRMLKARQIAPQDLQGALRSYDFKVAEVLWCLTDRDANARRFGALAIAQSSQADRIDALFHYIKQERSGDKLEHYATALSHMGWDAYTGLAKLVNDSMLQSRQLALYLLVRQPNWFMQRDMVETLLEDPEPVITAATIGAVVEEAPEAYTGLLRHLANDSRDEIRDVVLHWLIEQRDPENIEVFLVRLPQEKPPLREHLAEAILEAMKETPAEATEHVVAAIGDALPAVRRSAVEFFGRLPDRTDAVLQFLRHAIGSTDWMRDLLFREAARSPNEFVNGLLQVMKGTRDHDLRLTALNFAAVLDDQRLIPILLHELDCDDWVRRYNAIEILGNMKVAEATPYLLRLLDDSEVAAIAVASLVKMGDDSLVKHFLSHVPGADPFLQAQLLRAAAAVGDDRVVGLLVQLIERKVIAKENRPVAAQVLMYLCKEHNLPLPPQATYEIAAEETEAFAVLPDYGLMLEAE